MRTADEWTVEAFWSAEECRAEATKWEEVAKRAEAEGDTRDAASSRIYAAGLRQLARKKEVEAA